MEIIRYDENEKKLVAEEEVIKKIIDFEILKSQMELEEKKLRESLLEAMKKYNITSWQTDDGTIQAIYKKGTTRTTIDSARLKKELPDIAEEFSKTSEVKESVALSINI
jgi:predicted phage-related endonuclease